MVTIEFYKSYEIEIHQHGKLSARIRRTGSWFYLVEPIEVTIAQGIGRLLTLAHAAVDKEIELQKSR